MANPVESDQFVGSHEKGFPGKGTGYGQNGDPSASSLMPGKSKKNIPSVSVPSPTVANANASGDDARLAKIKSGGVKAHDGHRSRIGEGGNVPSANVRKAAGH